jgi:pyrroloquinoline-quinone synthase
MKLKRKRPQPVTLSDSLDTLIQQHSFRQHPFNLAWSQGKLSKESLQLYAVQYYQRVRAFPENLKQLASRATGSTKELIEAALAEELNPAASYPALWLQFARALDLTDETMEQAHSLPGIAAFLDTYEEVVTEGPVTQGIAAFYIYQVQAADVAVQKAIALSRYYHLTDPRALAYFDIQQVNGPRRAAAWREWLATEGEADAFAALCAAERCLKAVYGALDAVSPQTLVVSA